MEENRLSIARGIIPLDSDGIEKLSVVPIVCVLPDEVWPYAKIVTLYPTRIKKKRLKKKRLKTY